MIERKPEEQYPPQWEDVEQTVQLLGQLHGIDNLQVVTRPGAGWSCAQTSEGLIITVDPEQSTHGAGEKAAIQETDTPADVMTLFIVGHELGHARDMLESDYWQSRAAGRSRARDFFDCLIDDTVIDRRNRRLPRLSNHVDKIYAFQMPHDLSDMPKHAQLLYAMRVSTVVANPELTMDQDVAEALDHLINHQQGDKNFNIPGVIADPQTTLMARRTIADQFIWPMYQALLDQDREAAQNNPQHEQDDQPGQHTADDDVDDIFDAVYDHYDKTVHGHHHSNEPDNAGRPEHSSLGEQIAEAIRQATEAAKEAQEQAAGDRMLETLAAEREARVAQVDTLSKILAPEMALPSDEARKYAQSLIKLEKTIQDIATVFMQLAGPTETVQSLRYDHRARTTGQRLHPSQLGLAALQQRSGVVQNIMQPVVRRGKRQDVDFGGLDIAMLFDISGSMGNEGKSEAAAASGLAIMEGLQLAQEHVTRAAQNQRPPDVRTQMITFAENMRANYPLTHRPTSQQKGEIYHQLLHPNSYATKINSSLTLVGDAARQNPTRNTLAIIVSDGKFDDHNIATVSVATMPASVYVAHLVIGKKPAAFISEHNQHVEDPTLLPAVLLKLLGTYIERYQ